MKFAIILIFLLVGSPVADTSVVAEYYIENTADENYQRLQLSRVLKPLPQIYFSGYEKKFSWWGNYWAMKISIPKTKISFMCDRDSYKPSMTGLRLQPIEYITLPRNSDFRHYINKIVPMQWSIKAHSHKDSDKKSTLPEIKGVFLIRIIPKDNAERYTEDCGDRAGLCGNWCPPIMCQSAVDESCESRKLLKMPDDLIKHLPEVANLGDVISQNIPENCNTVFISEKIYNALDKNQAKILTDRLGKKSVKLIPANEINYCTRHDTESGTSVITVTSGNCRIDIRTNKRNSIDNELTDYLFLFGENKYLVKDHGKDSYILDATPTSL